MTGGRVTSFGFETLTSLILHLLFSIAPATTTLFFLDYLLTVNLSRTGWSKPLLESSCIEMISSRHIARLGKLVSSFIPRYHSFMQFHQGQSCSDLASCYPNKDDTDSSNHRLRVSESYVSLAIVSYRRCSNSKATKCLGPHSLVLSAYLRPP